MKKYDLHIHSTFSDGYYSLEERSGLRDMRAHLDKVDINVKRGVAQES